MALTVHQLHIFYTVAQQGSFSAAALALHMTQPAVTMQVQALEEHYGTKLFNRTTKKLELTEAGHFLLPRASQAVDMLRDTNAAMIRFAGELRGKLHFAASLTIGEYVLPRLLGKFLQTHPGLSVNMKVMNTTEILDAIQQQGLDFGLIEAPCEVQNLWTESVMDDELMLIAPADHPFTMQDEVLLEDVIREPFVLREKGSGTRQVMEDELRKHGVDETQIQVISEFGSTAAVKSAVEAGLGLSVLSAWTIKHELALGLLKTVRIRKVTFNRQFYAVRLPSALPTPPAAALMEQLRGLTHEPV